MNSARPRLLFLSQCLPYPTDEGVKIRTYNVLKHLSRDFDVRALCFYRKAGYQSEEKVRDATAALAKFADITTYAIPQEHSVRRALWDHGRSLLSRRAYTFWAYSSKTFRRDLHEALRDFRPDVIHIDSLDLSCYLRELPAAIPVICTHHNVESALLFRRSESETLLRRWYLRLQSRLTEKEERFWIPRLSMNVAVSDFDREAFQQICGDARFITVTNGVDTTEIRELPDVEGGLVFVGGSTWYPNRDALAYFANEILPLVRQYLPEIRVTWVGQCTEEDRVSMKDQYGIELTGYVDSIESYVADASCYVVPLRVGGGTRLKILYAWSMARAVVSTSIGCEGLRAIDGGNTLIRDTPQGFADAVVQVVGSPAFRRQLAREGRRMAETRYDWNVITQEMLAAYHEVMRSSRAAIRDAATQSVR